MTTTPDGPPVICIFGSSSRRPAEPLYEQACAIGHALAEAGYVVANGGYGGIMVASAKGANDAGGSTIGITCTIFRTARGQPLKANRYIDREIPCDDLLSRIDRMIRMSAGYVVLEGGTGTLSEFGMIWEYVAKGLITPRPIFVVGDFWKPVVDRILAVRPRLGRNIHCVQTAQQIVEIARKAITPPAP